jgi:hypothetical protein
MHGPIHCFREKGDRSAADLSIDRLAAKIKSCTKANALPLAGESDTASQHIPRLNYGRGAELRARFFCLEPGWLRGVITDLFNIPDSVRLALPRSPNLESKYQRV